MLYVNKNGVLMDEDKIVNPKDKFCNPEIYKYAMLVRATSSMSVLHQAISYYLELNYTAELERISRTEKNKGGDFRSSAYTVTAGLSKIQKTPAEIKKDLKYISGYLYTLKGSSTSFMNHILDKHDSFVRAYISGEDINKLEHLKEDRNIYQCVSIPNKEPCVLMLNSIRIKGLRITPFELDSLDKSLYLSHLTKFMEILGNFAIQGELEYRIILYEMYLFYILNKYFKYDVEELPI
jgi:hypothetical protein